MIIIIHVRVEKDRQVGNYNRCRRIEAITEAITTMEIDIQRMKKDKDIIDHRNDENHVNHEVWGQDQMRTEPLN